jgi:Calcium/calmodulin dependent protein kinase II Association.
MKTLMTSSLLATTLLFSAQAPAGEDPKVAAEVIALVRAEWAADTAGKPAAEQMVAAADDMTEFNPDFPTRIDGKDVNMRLTDGNSTGAGKRVAAEMLNPKVQVYGDTAILTYNYAGVTLGKDGKTTPSLAKTTRVFVKMNGKWMQVHANFAPAADKF